MLAVCELTHLLDFSLKLRKTVVEIFINLSWIFHLDKPKSDKIWVSLTPFSGSQEGIICNICSFLTISLESVDGFPLSLHG